MSTEIDTKALNEAFVDKITSEDTSLRKEAQQNVNDFTRDKMREDGFWRKILPPVDIANDELDRQVDTDKPVKIVDKEPGSPAAKTIPFATLPDNEYIHGPRYRVMFTRIVTPKFTKDVDELRTYDMDIRQILSDNAIKDMLAEEDDSAIAAVDTIVGAAGSIVTETGVAQHQEVDGGVTRETVNDALKIMPSTPSHLEVSTILVNNVFIKDVQKWGRDEVGGNLSEEIVRNGFAERIMLGARWIVSIKRELLGDDEMYMFAEPKFLGKFYVLEDTTMYIDKKAYFLEFFAYEAVGSAIGNVAAVAKATFTGSLPSDDFRYG
jgi:hypothetical protein